jgi:hypothetical protein
MTQSAVESDSTLDLVQRKALASLTDIGPITTQSTVEFRLDIGPSTMQSAVESDSTLDLVQRKALSNFDSILDLVQRKALSSLTQH